MNRGTDLHERLKKVSGKLQTLRDSCEGIVRTRLYPDFSWFEGAAAICQEAVDRIKEVKDWLEQCKGKPLTDPRDD